jgi:hypothetical protein
MDVTQESPPFSGPSMSRVLAPLATALLAAIVSPGGIHAQSAPNASAVHAALSGEWSGTLWYRDYQDSTRFVSLPTLLTGRLAPDSSAVQLAFTYDDGPGKTVRSTDRFSLDLAAHELAWGPAYGKDAPSRFAVQRVLREPLTLIVEMDGEDDDRNARIRETMTVENGVLRILKEVRFAPTLPWLFRHEYRLQRVR